MNPMENESPEIMGELPNPWKKSKGESGVNYDTDQGNGRGGSPVRLAPTRGTNIPDFGGINFDNTQTDFGTVKMSIDDDMGWEKKQGVLIDPTGKYKDIQNGFESKEIDISKYISVPGMPDDSKTHNTSTDCYGS